MTRFGHTVEACHWDEATLLWTVRARTAAGAVHWQAAVVVSAVGQLNRPKYAPIPGRDAFGGPSFHTAAWDGAVDLAGQRVAVIGTGPSAGQVIPAIAPAVAELHVFQRSPPHVLPRRDYRFPRGVRWAFRWLPGVQWLHRLYLFVMVRPTTTMATADSPRTNGSRTAVPTRARPPTPPPPPSASATCTPRSRRRGPTCARN